MHFYTLVYFLSSHPVPMLACSTSSWPTTCYESEFGFLTGNAKLFFVIKADFFSVMTSLVCPDGTGVFDRPEPPLEGWTALIPDSLPLRASFHGATRTAFVSVL